jgi:hypothetical protein
VQARVRAQAQELVLVLVRAWVQVQVQVQVLVQVLVLVLAWEQMGPWISRRASLHPPRMLLLCSNRLGRTSDACPHHTHPFPLFKLQGV